MVVYNYLCTSISWNKFLLYNSMYCVSFRPHSLSNMHGSSWLTERTVSCSIDVIFACSALPCPSPHSALPSPWAWPREWVGENARNELLLASWILNSQVWPCGGMEGEKMETNPVPVIAAGKDLLQIITAITVAVVAVAARRFPYCILDLRINSFKLAHLAHSEIYLMAESLKQVLLHLCFLPSSHNRLWDCLFISLRFIEEETGSHWAWV